jgi:hypothetical protein
LKLKWDVTRAERCELSPGKGRVPCSGSIDLQPKINTDYTLTAYDANNQSTSQKISTKVKPRILEFRVDARDERGRPIKQGRSANVIWRVCEGPKTDVRLLVNGQERVLTEKRGSTLICVDKEGRNTFKLLVLSGDGEEAEVQAGRDVQIAECSTWDKVKCGPGKMAKLSCPCKCPEEK